MIDDKRAGADYFLYECDDGSREFMGREGGSFKEIDCDDPRVFPLYIGGRIAGMRMSKLPLATPGKGIDTKYD